VNSAQPQEAEQPASRAPGTFGPYEVIKRLSAPGLVETFRAIDVEKGGQVALKVLHAESQGRYERAAQLFRGVGFRNRQLDDPALVPLLSVCRDGASPFVATALAEGPNLESWRNQGAFQSASGLKKMRGVLVGVTEAMARLHSRTVPLVHGGLSPGNIFVTQSGIQIADAGFSSALRPFMEPDACGFDKWWFVAPELVLDPQSRPDSMADIYSLGAVLFFAATGNPPIRARSLAEWQKSLQKGETSTNEAGQHPDSSATPGLGAVLEAAFDLMARAPADRPQSMRDALARLTAAFDTAEAAQQRHGTDQLDVQDEPLPELDLLEADFESEAPLELEEGLRALSGSNGPVKSGPPAEGGGPVDTGKPVPLARPVAPLAQDSQPLELDEPGPGESSDLADLGRFAQGVLADSPLIQSARSANDSTSEVAEGDDLFGMPSPTSPGLLTANTASAIELPDLDPAVSRESQGIHDEDERRIRPPVDPASIPALSFDDSSDEEGVVSVAGSVVTTQTGPVVLPRRAGTARLVSAEPKRKSLSKGSTRGLPLALALLGALGAGGFVWWQDLLSHQSSGESSGGASADSVAQSPPERAETSGQPARESALDRETAQRARAQEAAVAPARGQLDIQTTPKGARVWIDGVERGRTPLKLQTAPGSHRIVMTKPGFKMLREVADTSEGLSLKRSLPPANINFGGRVRLRVDCKTEGKFPVFIDGKDTGLLCPLEDILIPEGNRLIGLYVIPQNKIWSFERDVLPGSRTHRVVFSY